MGSHCSVLNDTGQVCHIRISHVGGDNCKVNGEYGRGQKGTFSGPRSLALLARVETKDPSAPGRMISKERRVWTAGSKDGENCYKASEILGSEFSEALSRARRQTRPTPTPSRATVHFLDMLYTAVALGRLPRTTVLPAVPRISTPAPVSTPGGVHRATVLPEVPGTSTPTPVSTPGGEATPTILPEVPGTSTSPRDYNDDELLYHYNITCMLFRDRFSD